MFETVEIPVWLLIVVGLLAAIAFLDRLLMPSVRWYLRKRFNKAIARLNERLQLGIKPFTLTRRRVMIDRLAHDPEVLKTAVEHARKEGIPREVAMEKAQRYAREIVPSFSAFAYFSFAVRVAKWLSQSLYRVRLGYMNDAALKKIDPEAAVVFVMNHRSNMDYVLVTYLAASRSYLSYAVGEWARVWPLQQLIRSLGGYFIRRRSRDSLYRRVLARYVQMATDGGVTQAVFPEGGLSRNGLLGEAKLGLIGYIASDFDPETSRDVVFVPIGLNYDRVLEDRVLLAAKNEGPTKFGVKVGATLGMLCKHFWLRMTGRFYKFGYACVGFGEPLSLKSYLEGQDLKARKTITEDLGAELMRRVGRVIPVLPVSLVSTTFLSAGDKAISRETLKTNSQDLLHELRDKGAYCHVPRNDEDYTFEVGLRMLLSRGLVREDETGLTLEQEGKPVLQYYANAILHLM